LNTALARATKMSLGAVMAVVLASPDVTAPEAASSAHTSRARHASNAERTAESAADRRLHIADAEGLVLDIDESSLTAGPSVPPLCTAAPSVPPVAGGPTIASLPTVGRVSTRPPVAAIASVPAPSA